MSNTAKDHRARTLEWIVREILTDEPDGMFTADLHRLIEERTTISLNMHRLVRTLGRMRRDHQLAAAWIGARQRFCLPPEGGL